LSNTINAKKFSSVSSFFFAPKAKLQELKFEFYHIKLR